MTPEEIVERAAEVLIDHRYPNIGWGALSEVAKDRWRAKAQALADAGLLPTEVETRRRYHVVNNRTTNTERRYVTPWVITS